MAQKISEQTLREIAEKVPILDVVSSCVQMTRSGKYYKGLCPFHPDKNPSMIVNPERNTFHCFACGTGGNAYSFYMKFHNVPFLDAVTELARLAGVDLNTRTRQEDPRQQEAVRRALDLNREAARFFSRSLMQAPGSERARRYLEDRGVEHETIRAFSIGYAPAEWDGLARFLARPSSALPLAATLGLIQPRKSGQGYYDRFRNRIMFPIQGVDGEILAFGGRTLETEGPKYVNSPESFLYKKGAELYGLHQAQESIRRQGRVVLVEGYMDLIAMHRNGFVHAVAVLGTALTQQQIRTLKRYSRHFVFLFDGDDAGRQASYRNLPEILDQRVDARVVYLPPEDDPDTFLRRNGAQRLAIELEAAVPLLDAFLRDRTEPLTTRRSVEHQVRVLREVIPVLRSIPDRLEQQLRIRDLAERLGIGERLLQDELGQPAPARDRAVPPVPTEPAPPPRPRWPAEERLICQILIQFPGLARGLPHEGDVLDAFSDPALKRFVEDLCVQVRERATLFLPELLARQEDPAVANLITALSCRDEFTEEEAAAALRDGLVRIRRRNLQARLRRLNQKIREAETLCRKDLQERLFLEKQHLLDQEKALQH